MGVVTVTPEYFSKEKDAVVSSHRMSYYEVRGNPEGYNPQRMLASLPGVGTVEDYSSQLIVRGGDPDENLCLIDGIEIQSPIHFSWFGGEEGSISIIPTTLIKEIGFSSGGFPARYGDKLSSFMDIELRDGNRERLEATFDFNMSAIELDLESPLGDRGSLIASYGRSYLELLDKVSDIGNVVPKYNRLFGKAAFDISARNKVSVLGIKTIDDMVVPMDGESDLVWKGGQDVVGLNWRWLFSNRGYSRLVVSGSSYSLDLDAGSAFGIRSTQANLAVNSQVVYKPFHWGEAEAELSLKPLFLEWSSFFSPETTATGIPLDPDTLYAADTSYKFSGYLQTSIATPFFSIKPGMRYDYFDLNNEARISPRIGMSCPLSGVTELNLAYGEFYQFPSYEQLLGDRLSSKHSRHYVAGIEHLLAPGTRFSIEAYRKSLDRLPVAKSDSTSHELDNSGTGYANGIDLLLHKKLVDKVYGSISYSYSVSRRKDRRGEYFSSWDQRHIFTLIGGYKISDDFELSAKFRYASGRPYTPVKDRWQDPNTGKWYRVDGPINSARYPDYHRLDFQISRREVFKGWAISYYLNIQNLYNRKNILAYRYNDDYTEKEGIYQFLFMPVGGITIEF
jgi:hypothetical protein